MAHLLPAVALAVLEAAEDIDVVHGWVSDAGWGGCRLRRGLLASAIRTSGPVESALRAGPRASRKGDPNDAKLEPISRFHRRVGRASEGSMMRDGPLSSRSGERWSLARTIPWLPG